MLLPPPELLNKPKAVHEQLDERNSAGLISLRTATACHMDEQENEEACQVMRSFQ